MDLLSTQEKGLGSFFNLFEQEGEDENDFGSNLCEWFAHALE